MKKSILIAALVLAAGLFAVRPSAAQSAGGTVYSENAGTQEGQFTVLATQVSTYVWDVSVTYVKTLSSNGEYPWAYLDGLNMSFFSGATAGGSDGTSLSLGTGSVAAVGSATGGAGTVDWTTGPGAGNQGSSYQYNDTRPFGGGTVNGWTTSGLITTKDGTTNPGSLQTFTGVVTLNSSNTLDTYALGTAFAGETYAQVDSKVNVIGFGVQNSGEVNAYYSVAPEGQSLALLLPGLIPLGLVLRRRRKA